MPSKSENYWETEFFSLSGRIFLLDAQKVLQRVGNTDRICQARLTVCAVRNKLQKKAIDHNGNVKGAIS
jgi:hypothetical protein